MIGLFQKFVFYSDGARPPDDDDDGGGEKK